MTGRAGSRGPQDHLAFQLQNAQGRKAGKVGPIAWQMRNTGLFDEYKDVIAELDPVHNELITVAEAQDALK